MTALATFLDDHAAGLPIRRVDVASLSVLKTADPPYTALTGRIVAQVRHIGKYLVIDTVPGPDDTAAEPHLSLVVHLSRAGWLRWSENLSPAPPRPGGKGPIALRVHCGLPGEGFDLTEAGTRKRLAGWIVRDVTEVERIASLGPEVLGLSREDFADLLAQSGSRIKTVLTDQRRMAGIGNAYSDEILHRARLSPVQRTGNLSDVEVAGLQAAVEGVLGEWRDRLIEEVGDGWPTKVTAFRPEMAVHGRFREPCPVCGAAVQRIVHADAEMNYCPGCQTGGRVLADRSLSRLLGDDWEGLGLTE